MTAAGQLADIIYTDRRDRRIEELAAGPKNCSPALPQAEGIMRGYLNGLPPRFHRVTLFTTFRCSFRCHYCRTIKNRAGKNKAGKNRADADISRADFQRMLDQLLDPIYNSKVEHLHFTGGEATLVKDLPQMVAMATLKGIPCSLTSNGAADPALYRRLLEAGIREIRISLDTDDPAEFARITGVSDGLGRVLATIRELVRLRDEAGYPLYLILNICVTTKSRHRLPGFLEFALSLKSDDIKLIPALENCAPPRSCAGDCGSESGAGAGPNSDAMSDFSGREGLLDELDAILNDLPPDRYPLLRLKRHTIFARHTWGLRDAAAARLIRHCYVPLTERTYTRSAYYPCPVYVREGGAALGPVSDSMIRQQERSEDFFRNSDCPSDEICRDNCIHCLKLFNTAANARLNRQIRGKSGKWEPVTLAHTARVAISEAEVRELVEQIREERKGFAENPEWRPFLVIKPGGMDARDQVEAELGKNGIRITERISIFDWNQTAARIYPRNPTEDKARYAIVMAKALPELEGRRDGELWMLERRGSESKSGLITDEDISMAELTDCKNRLRRELPTCHYVIYHGMNVYPISHGYIHTPSPELYRVEAGVLFDRQNH